MTVSGRDRDRLLEADVAKEFLARVVAQPRTQGLTSDEHPRLSRNSRGFKKNLITLVLGRKQITERIKDVDRWAIIDISSLPKPPPATDPSIHFTEKEMYDAFQMHNLIARKRQALQDALQRSQWEKFLIVISPLLAVIALALRITKVTGEIRLG